MQKLSQTLVGMSAEGFAKFFKEKLIYPIVAFICVSSWGLITGHPEITILLCAIVILFLLGVWLGLRFAEVQYPYKAKAIKQKMMRDGDFVLFAAYYGNDEIWQDVTDEINAKIKKGKNKFIVNNTNVVGGNEFDPYEYREKRLIGAYAHNQVLTVFDNLERSEIEFP